MKKGFLLISAMLLFVVGYTQSSQRAQPSPKLEDRIIDTVAHLPEVQRREAYVEKQTHN